MPLLCNLFSGCIAVFYAEGSLDYAALFVVIGIAFDFSMVSARILNVQGELGKQLDSLADTITLVWYQNSFVSIVASFFKVKFLLVSNGEF